MKRKTVKKTAVEPVDIKFRNSPSEILDLDTFDQVCMDISVLERKLTSEMKRLSKKHGVRLSLETFYRLEQP